MPTLPGVRVQRQLPVVRYGCGTRDGGKDQTSPASPGSAQIDRAGQVGYNNRTVTAFYTITSIWAAAVLVTLAAAFRLWWNGMAMHFPTVWIYLLVSGLRGAVLLLVFQTPATYAAFYSRTAPLQLLVEAFAVVGVFFAVAEYYPKFRGPGTALLTALAIMGATGTWWTREFARPAQWTIVWSAAVLSERYAWTVMVVMLLGSQLMLPRVKGIPIRPAARRASNILALQLAASVVSALLAASATATYLNYCLPVSANLVLGLAWLLYVTPSSHKCADPAKLTVNEIAFGQRPPDRRSYVLLGRMFASRQKLR
jgi:hypothetical protein